MSVMEPMINKLKPVTPRGNLLVMKQQQRKAGYRPFNPDAVAAHVRSIEDYVPPMHAIDVVDIHLTRAEREVVNYEDPRYRWFVDGQQERNAPCTDETNPSRENQAPE